MSLLPYIDLNKNLIDGTGFHLLPFCKKMFSSRKCTDHYASLIKADGGCYSCPYGLTSYVYITPEERTIFTGLRVKGKYDKRKAKISEAKEYIYNPVIEECLCASIAQEASVSILEKHQLEEKLEAIRDLLHEARSLNGQIKNRIDQLWEENPNEDDEIEYDKLLLTLKNAHVCSFMISNRFAYFDSILNPSLSIGSPYSAVIFKKFDKMRKLLKEYQRKNVWISLYSASPCNYRYKIFPTFETLVFILLENAIKYSPDNKPVEVNFCECDNILDITIKSTGPYCDENEILHICEKGFRGNNAKLIQTSGQGFGLSFAKKICIDHNIGISFDSYYLNKDHGVKYGTFSVHLHFDNSEEKNCL